MTGTPVQNSLEDLASLVAFIRASPLDKLPGFRKHIITPVLKGTDQGFKNIGLLLESVCLRRTKKLLHLPDVVDKDRFVEFSSIEKSVYTGTQAEMIAIVKKHDSQARNSKNYFGMFQLLLQLRRLCNHGTFQKTFPKSPEDDIQFDPEQAFELLTKEGTAECHYCKVEIEELGGLEEKTYGLFTACGHLLCSNCVSCYRSSLRESTEDALQCSLCMKRVPKNCIVTTGSHFERFSLSSSNKAQKFESTSVSSKVATLITDIKNSESEGKRYAIFHA